MGPVESCNQGSSQLRLAVLRFLTASALLTFAALAFSSSAAAYQTRSLLASFGPDGSAASEFAYPSQVAVDPADGTTYVGDLAAGTIEKFDSAHQPERFTGSSPQISEGRLTGFTASIAAQLAVDPTSHVLYAAGPGAGVVAYHPDGEPAEFTTGPAAGTNELAGSEVCGVAVDSNGDIYVSEFSSGIRVFEPDGEPLAAVGISGACNLAVGSHGRIYYDQPYGSLQALAPNEFPLTPSTFWGAPVTVDPNPTTTVAADPANGDVLADEAERIAEYDPAGHRLGSFGAAPSGLVNSTGLAVSPAGGVYATDDEGASRQVQIFGPPALLPPSIDAVEARNLSGSAADLTAKINPGGLPTRYRFEYGSSTAYGTSVPAPEAQIGEGFGDVAVSQHVEGLSPGVTYHWRVVASGSGGTATGVDHTFVYDTSGAALPDGRQYEMVTPPQKNGALIGAVFSGLQPVVSADAKRVVMVSIQCFAGAQSCTGTRQAVGSPYLFSRTPSGWATTALAPPASGFPANSTWMASADTGMVLFSSPAPPGLEDDFYVAAPGGELTDLGPATPPAEGQDAFASFSAGSKAATSDFSHLVFATKAPWISPGTGYEFYELTRSAAPRSPLPVPVSGGPGDTSLISRCGSSFTGFTSGKVPGEISADGETVYFTASACPSGTGANEGVEVPANTLYARIDQGRTVKISEPSPSECSTPACLSSPPQDAHFAGASDDGSRAFFLSDQRLTDSASEEGNLYEYDFDRAAGHNLTDLSAAGTPGQAAQVQGVVALSSDGSHVYFVARGALSEAPNDRGETAQRGADNLYVFARDADHPDGRLAFLARLPEADESLWNTNDESATANVTPDGRYLLFESSGRLTADAGREDGAVQIYRYDVVTGELIRISRGERGYGDDGNAGSGNAHITAGFLGTPRAGPARRDPSMSDDGSYVFFESPIALTPGALDDLQIGANGGQPVYAKNIYEWHQGHLGLISDGQDTTELAVESATKLVGVGTDAHNVLLRTADPLLPQDTDTQIDYYDVHLCNAAEPCLSPPPPPSLLCSDEQCRGQAAPAPSEPAGGSSTPTGAENLHPRHHRHHRKRHRCAGGRRRLHRHCAAGGSTHGKRRRGWS